MIFISYKKQDSEDADDDGASFRYAKRMAEYFGAMNDPKVNKLVWWDGELVPGKNWKEELSQMRDLSTAAICFVSTKYLSSPFCRDKELLYFIARGIDIYWFLVDDCPFSYHNQLKDIQSANARLGQKQEPLVDMEDQQVQELIRLTADLVYKNHIQDKDLFVLSQPINNLFKCNRTIEAGTVDEGLQLFNNLKCNNFIFSIEGLASDSLNTLPKSLYFKSDIKRYKDKGYKVKQVLFPNTISETLRSTTDPSRNLFKFQIQLRKQLPELLDDELKLVYEFDEKTLLLLTINIPSTSFKAAVYEKIIDWLRDHMCSSQANNPDYAIILLLTFEKSDYQDTEAAREANRELEAFIKQNQGRYFVDVDWLWNNKSGEGQPGPTYILHLGSHHLVEEADVRAWYETELGETDEAYYQQNIGSKLQPPIRMKNLEDVLKKFLEAHNKQLI